MRIIAGRLKGRKLVGFSASHIRPTSDIVKGSIFNKLQMHIDGASVLDLFSGTGNLGIEAYSRGARHVTFVENHTQSLKILKNNLNTLDLVGPGVEVIAMDVMKFLSSYKGAPYNIILIDPPFTKELAHPTMLRVAESAAIDSDSLVVIESSKRERLDSDYNDLKRYDVREFGDKTVSYFETYKE